MSLNPIEQALMEHPGPDAPAEAPEAEAEASAEEPTGEAAGEEAPEEPAEPETPAEAADAPADPDAVFSDDALSTPDGMLKAREWIDANRRSLQKQHHKIERKQQKLAERVKVQAREREAFAQAREQFVADVQAIRRGNAADTLAALSKMTGKDPKRFVEELNWHIASDGKQSAPEREDPHAERLAKIEAEIRRRDEAAAREAQMAELRKARAEVVEMAKTAKNEKGEVAYPAVSEWIGDDSSRAEEAADWIQSYMIAEHEAGNINTKAQANQARIDACAELDRRIASFAAAAAKKAGREAGTKQAPQKRPVRTAPKPAEPPKQESNQARLQRLANDTDFLKSVGIF